MMMMCAYRPERVLSVRRVRGIVWTWRGDYRGVCPVRTHAVWSLHLRRRIHRLFSRCSRLPWRTLLRSTHTHTQQINIYNVRQKKGTDVLSVCIFFNTWQKLMVNFFTHIWPEESRAINYNSLYFIMVYVENFAATVTVIKRFMFTGQVSLMKLMITG